MISGAMASIKYLKRRKNEGSSASTAPIMRKPGRINNVSFVEREENEKREQKYRVTEQLVPNLPSISQMLRFSMRRMYG